MNSIICVSYMGEKKYKISIKNKNSKSNDEWNKICEKV